MGTGPALPALEPSLALLTAGPGLSLPVPKVCRLLVAHPLELRFVSVSGLTLVPLAPLSRTPKNLSLLRLGFFCFFLNHGEGHF